MKQRFSTRTRLVSALLTLAMVFTFLPFSAFAATVQEIEVLAFTTHGCDALQITEGGSVGEWITAFRKKMEKTGEEPINATSGYGFYVRTNYNDWYVVDRLDRLYSLPQTDSFQRGEKYYLSVPIGAAEGYIFNTSRDFRFKKITVDGEDLSDVLKKPYQYAESQRTRVYIPLSFTGRHKPEIISDKAATCITSGVKRHYKCQKCGKLFMDYECTEETTPAKVQIKPTRLHTPGDWNKAWSRHYQLCKVCGKDVNAGAHNFVGGKCTDCGLERHDLDSAEVEVTEPAAGMTPAMIAAKNVTPDKKTAFSTACTWYEADSGAELSNTAVFAEGKQYRAELKLTARVDWQFLNSTTYKINGTAAEKNSSSDPAPWEQVTLSRIFTAKPAEEGKVITNIQMTIPAPVAGNSPSSCKVQKSDPRYTIKSLRWTEVDAAGNPISHDVTTFEEGKHYQVRIRLNSNVGFEFEGDKQEAIINGKPYLSYTSSGMDPKDLISYYVTFTAVAGGGSTGDGTGTTTPPSGGEGTGTTTPPSGGGTGTTTPPSGGEGTGTTTPPSGGGTGTTTPPSGGGTGTTTPPSGGEGTGTTTPPSGGGTGTTTPPSGGEGTGTTTPPSGGGTGTTTPPSGGGTGTTTPPSGGGTGTTTPPSGGDGGGGAIVMVAGAAVAGVVGYGVYNYVSGQKLQALLPEGVAAPENRAQTALLLWNTAGRPEPAEAPAFADVADPDTAKAAQWCVEQGLMKRRLNGKFAPDSNIPAYQVLNAYRKLAG